MNPEPNPSAPAPAGAAPAPAPPGGLAPVMPGPAGPAPVKPASSGVKFGVTMADLIVAGGAFFILLFSWAPVVDSKYGHLTFREGLGTGVSLWSWLRPLGLFVILAALLLIATAAIETWWQRDKPMVGVHRHHVQVALALFCLVTIFGMGLADPYGGFVTIGWGAFPQLLGALAAAAGAVLNHFNLLQNKLSLPESTPAAYPPPAAYPAGYPAPGQPGQPGQPVYGQQPGQPVYGQPVPGQPVPGQAAGLPVPGQPAQPAPSQPAQPAAAQPAAVQPAQPAAGNVPPVPGNVPPAAPTAADPNSLI